ncbi:phytase [Marinifilum sp.]|uniref:phytase n=1 Tax=Marinifilum sp. TaxID=2033137 RepID=UPI003BA9EBE4
MRNINTFIGLIWITFSLAIAYSCDRESEGSRKASLLIEKVTTADAETDALKNRSTREDAADDPAIWINFSDASQSRIIGTDKKGGIAVYNLQGKELFFYADGKMNNVDVRQKVQVNNDLLDIAACSNRTTNTIDFYRISESGELQKYPNAVKVKMSDEVYGFCLAMNNNKLYAFVNSVFGNVEQWEIKLSKEKVEGQLVRKIKLESKTEGMVADDEAGSLFIGEEAKGIWKISIDPNQSSGLEMLSQSTVKGNKNIYEDIEGLCIFKEDNGEGYLIASSQGNYSYAVFDRKAPHKYLGSFRISDGTIDGVEETDGIEVINYNLGEDFPKGLFIAQDGYNKFEGKSTTQNFKMVRWEKIANLFEPNLSVLQCCEKANSEIPDQDMPEEKNN